eukprot:403334400
MQKFDDVTKQYLYKNLIKTKDKLVKCQFVNGQRLGELEANHLNKMKKLKKLYKHQL